MRRQSVRQVASPSPPARGSLRDPIHRTSSERPPTSSDGLGGALILALELASSAAQPPITIPEDHAPAALDFPFRRSGLRMAWVG
eukprot:13679279-Alexandrium_andersonii.AAC.1